MSQDVECPYCGKWNEINHDDGYGYQEDILHEQCCSHCQKNFTFTTSIIFHYDAFVADCLNGKPHDFEPQTTFPKEFTKMKCKSCEQTRKPTEEEMKQILKL